MKEYATLTTEDIQSPYSYPQYSRRQAQSPSAALSGMSQLETMGTEGWRVIATAIATSCCANTRYCFVLERQIPKGES